MQHHAFWATLAPILRKKSEQIIAWSKVLMGVAIPQWAFWENKLQ